MQSSLENMFAQLKTIVDLVRGGVSDFRAFQAKEKRHEVVLELLRVYFVLLDCVDDGESLITEAQPNPVSTISKMPADEALNTLTRWDELIRQQGRRLFYLQNAFLGQHHLVVINPELKKQIDELIGYKLDRTVTLHSIGATLYFKNIFPKTETAEEKARYISVMAGELGDALNMSRITAEIKGLREALNNYRAIVERMVSDEEILVLSERARLATQI